MTLLPTTELALKEAPPALSAEDKGLLRNVRKLVASTHWTKREYATEKDGKRLFCLVGAIEHETDSRFYWAITDSPGRHMVRAVAAAILRLHPRTRATDIESWNDRPATKREDVLAVIDEALKPTKKA